MVPMMNRVTCVGVVVGLLLVACERRAGGGVGEDPERGSGRVRPVVADGSMGGQGFRDSLDEARRMAAGAERNERLAELAWNAIEREPEVAEDAMELLPAGGRARIELTSHLAMRMADEDLEGALEWALDLPSENEMAAAFGRIALVMAERDPVEAATLLSETGVAGRELDVALVEALSIWSNQSPVDAAEWVALFPEGAARDAGFREVISEWVEQDVSAAWAWVEARDDGVIRELAGRELEHAWLALPAGEREAVLDGVEPDVATQLRRLLPAAE